MKVSVLNYLAKLPTKIVIGICLILIILIGIIDYLIILDLAFSIFYLFPIIIATWFVNKQLGIVCSILSTFSWVRAELHAKIYPYTWIPCWNSLVRLSYFIIIIYFILDLKKAYINQKKLANTDVLTGLVNRRFFTELLQLESLRSLRYQRPLTLVYLDLDNFKLINDRYGHEKGDQVLQLIAQTMKQNLRATDTIARLGGDEFAILLAETNYESAQVVLKKLHHYCWQATQADFSEVGFSVGAITFLQPLSSTSQMLTQVDSLMYEVKKTGKNNIKHISISHTN